MKAVSTTLGFVFAFGIICMITACSDGPTMVCFPNTYRCGGDEGSLLQRCDSTTKRWETLRDCEEQGQVCVLGACITESDGDAEPDDPTDGDVACTADIQCDEDRICVEGECVDSEAARHDLALANSRLIYRNDTGRLDIYNADNEAILLQLTAKAVIADEDGGQKVISMDGAEPRTVEKGYAHGLSDGETLEISMVGYEGKLEAIWQIAAFQERSSYTFSLRLVNKGQATIEIASVSPLSTSDNGGLYPGADRSSLVLWDNGSEGMDTSSIVAVDDSLDIESNLVLGLSDSESGMNMVVGSLSQKGGLPLVRLAAGQSSGTEAGKRKGIGDFEVTNEYGTRGCPLEEEFSLTADSVYLQLGDESLYEMLGRFADASAEERGLSIETGKTPASFWMSGIAGNLDETTMIESVRMLSTQFAEWGLEGILIEKGYLGDSGEWDWDEQRFPAGPKALSDNIREAGFIAGLCIDPLAVSTASNTATDHPEWLATIDESIASAEQGQALLDPTILEVGEYLEMLADTFVGQWGYNWLALDAMQWMTGARDLVDPKFSGAAAYRLGISNFSKYLPLATGLSAQELPSLHWGLVQAAAVSTATLPTWSVAEGDDEEGIGMLQAAASSTRRGYLHERIWNNQASPIYFVSDSAAPESGPSFHQSRSYAAFVGLSGAAVTLGDDPRDLQADEINVIRRLLPATALAARPLDVLQSDNPSFYHLAIDQAPSGLDESYHVVGIFNWNEAGQNSFDLDLRKLGLPYDETFLAYEFWSGSFLGKVQGHLETDIEAFDNKIFSLRRLTGYPQFVGTNRHIIMGAATVSQAKWDDVEGRLVIRAKVAAATERAPFTYRFDLYVPDGFSFKSASYSGVPTLYNNEGLGDHSNILRIEFVPATGGEIEIGVDFN